MEAFEPKTSQGALNKNWLKTRKAVRSQLFGVSAGGIVNENFIPALRSELSCYGRTTVSGTRLHLQAGLLLLIGRCPAQ